VTHAYVAPRHRLAHTHPMRRASAHDATPSWVVPAQTSMTQKG
jgi:hypothetical protein